MSARGIPQHVVDKLDLPELPEGYRWRIWKPAPPETWAGPDPDGRDLDLNLRIETHVRWWRTPRTIVNSNEIAPALRSWSEDSDTSLVIALSAAAWAMYDSRFHNRADHRDQVDDLWSKR